MTASNIAETTTSKSSDENIVVLCGRCTAVLTFSVYASRLGNTPTRVRFLTYPPMAPAFAVLPALPSTIGQPAPLLNALR